MDKKSISEFYDQYVERQKHTGINERHFTILDKSKKHGLKNTDSILEVGCGIGTVTSLLSKFARNGFVLGVDISAKSIEFAKKRWEKYDNVQFKVLDVTEELPKEKNFDTIILPDVIEHIPIEQHGKLFRNLANLLAKDGKILINIPNPFFLEWCHQNRPDLLQVIDQPIYLSTLLSKISKTDLYIHYLETYSIWKKDCDFQFIVLKKKSDLDHTLEKKQSLIKAINLKLRQFLALRI